MAECLSVCVCVCEVGAGEQISRGLDEQRDWPQNKAHVLALCLSPSPFILRPYESKRSFRPLFSFFFFNFFIAPMQGNILSLINMTL